MKDIDLIIPPYSEFLVRFFHHENFPPLLTLSIILIVIAHRGLVIGLDVATKEWKMRVIVNE